MVTVANQKQNFTEKAVSESYVVALRGLSTDAKPTKIGENSTFLEMDTGNVYYFSGGTWQGFASNGSIVGLAVVGTAIVG